MVRSRTWPGPGVGGAYSSRRKSDDFGSPCGREARTMRLADCDMGFPPGLLLSRQYEKQSLGANPNAVIPGRSAGPTRNLEILRFAPRNEENLSYAPPG